MFGMLESIAKTVVGIVFSPVDIAADILTCGGSLSDRGEPYTVSRARQILRNMDNAVNPDELTDRQIQEIVIELNRRR